jgi:hypothetical protein
MGPRTGSADAPDRHLQPLLARCHSVDLIDYLSLGSLHASDILTPAAEAASTEGKQQDKKTTS